MASNKPKKRKLSSKPSGSKQPRLQSSKSTGPPKEASKRPPIQQQQKRKWSESSNFEKPAAAVGKELTKRQLRLRAKELAEARNKKRKKHYTLEQELASLWERMRRWNIAKDDRSNIYAIHLVKKMLDNASKMQLAGFISSLHRHVASLLRNMVGSVVVEHAYQIGKASQKQELLSELYSTELQLFKGLVSTKENRLHISYLYQLPQKGSVLHHMSSNIQLILEKGIVDHSITHRLLIEYLSIADQERKKIIKGMKDHKTKIAHDQYGSLVLACIVSTVDDMKLVAKMIIRELKATLKELVLDKCFLEVTPDESDEAIAPGENVQSVEGGKKDPSLRRKELLIGSVLAENLVDICIENAGELLKSNFGKEVIYEVMTGGSGAILHPSLDDKLDNLYEAVASLAALPKTEEAEEEHVLENFHSSRTLRKLVFECPAFASVLWKKALQGNSKLWAQGHSSKVVSAFWESSEVKEMAQDELKPLIDQGILKIPQSKESA